MEKYTVGLLLRFLSFFVILGVITKSFSLSIS
jgi:hypothetical protein